MTMTKHVMGTLVDGRCNITRIMATKMEKHTNNTGIVDRGIGRFIIDILWESISFNSSILGRGIGAGESKSINYILVETTLSEEKMIRKLLNVYTMGTFSRTYLANPDVVFLKPSNSSLIVESLHGEDMGEGSDQLCEERALEQPVEKVLSTSDQELQRRMWKASLHFWIQVAW